MQRNRDETWFNWEITDYQRLSIGDQFYLIKNGYGQTGIVAKGYISSEPYTDNSKANQDEKHYADCMPEIMLNPDSLPILSIDALQKLLPDIDWADKRSGILLSEAQTQKMNELWEDYIHCNKDLLNHLVNQQRQDSIYCAPNLLEEQ